MALFFALGLAGAQIGVAFYIWLGIFNFMIVSQFEAFANDIYTEEQGKRLFPIIGIGISFGALAGAKLTSAVIARLGPYQLMMVATGMLLVFVALLVWINRRESGGGRQEASETAAQPPVWRATNSAGEMAVDGKCFRSWRLDVTSGTPGI